MALPQISNAQTVTQQVFAQYSLKGVSAWPNGSTTATNLGSFLLGPSWNFGPVTAGGYYDLQIPSFSIGPISFPGYDLGKTGAETTFGGSGKLGLQATPWYSGGTMDLSYGAGVSVTYPEFPTTGSQVTISATFAANSGSSFETYTPDFGITLGAAFQVSGHASGDIEFAGDDLWNGTILPQFTIGSNAIVPIGQFTDFANTTQINQLISALNPAPVGASIYKPILASSASLPDSNGVLQTTSFGKFMTVETDALSWIALLFGDDKPAVLGVLSGDYSIPDTSLEASWDICKAYADMDIGFYGTYTLTPKPTISLSVLDTTGKVIASGGSSLTFTMPATGVTIVPSMAVNFQFENKIGFGTQGEFGIDPFSVSLVGGYGSGVGAQTIDIEADPATEEWTSSVAGGLTFIDKTFVLPLSKGMQQQTLAGIGVNAADLQDLPREVFVGSSPTRTIKVQAYTPDADKDYATVALVPEQGRTFLYGTSGSGQTIGATIVNPQTGLSEVVNIGFRSNTEIDLQIPSADLIPGQTSVSLHVSGINASHQLRDAWYSFVTTIYDKTPNIDGQFFTTADLDATKTTNRVLPNSGDQWIYCGADGIYTTTKAILNSPNGPVLLPTDITSDQDVTGRDYIGIKIPAEVVAAYGGGALTIQLENPNQLTDNSGKALPPLLSTPKSIYFVAGKPSISGVTVAGTSGVVPLGDRDANFTLKGSNFTNLTTVTLDNLSGPFQTVALTTAYSSPSVIHVTVPASVLQLVHNSRHLQASMVAATPVAQVPPDSNDQSAITSGGTSLATTLNFGYPTPLVNLASPSILVRQVANTITITGANFFRPPLIAGAPISGVTIQGRIVPANEIAYSGAGTITAQTLTVSLPANDANLQQTGLRSLYVTNGTVNSSKGILNVVNGVPVITTTSIDVEVGPGISNKVTINGAPFYPESKFTVNGTNEAISSQTISSITANLDYAHLNPLLGSTTQAVVFNPTPQGGTSNPVQIRLLERDPSTITVKKGPFTYDRLTQTWAESLTFAYTGHRILTTTAELEITNLPAGVTLTNADGANSGVGYKNVQFTNGGALPVIVRFTKTPSAVISFDTLIHFTN